MNNGILGAAPDLFKESPRSLATMALLVAFIIVSFIFISANVTGQTNALFIFTLMLVGLIAGLIIEIVFQAIKKEPQYFAFVGLGKNLFLGSVISLIALWLGFFLVSINLTIPLPLSVSFETVSIEFVYTNIFAPILEDAFFRGFLIPTIAAGLSVIFFSKRLGTQPYIFWFFLAMVLSGVFFGISHYLAFGFQTTLIFNAIVWSLIVAGLMLVSRSIAPAILMHFANNITVYYGKAEINTTIAILISITLFIVFLNIVQFARQGTKHFSLEV